MPDPQPTQRQVLADAHERVTAHLSLARAVLPDLTDAELNFKPSPKAWSVAEVLSHLLHSMHAYYDKMDPAVRSASESKTHLDKPYRTGFIGGQLIKAVKNHGRKVPAPKLFKPNKDKGGATRSNYTFRIVDNYLAELESLIDRLDSYEHYDLESTRFPNPLTKLIRMKLGDAVILHPAHLERHWAQIERTIAKAEAAAAQAGNG
ncbi:MAG: DinB family protein [Bacteroidota bacterium]